MDSLIERKTTSTPNQTKRLAARFLKQLNLGQRIGLSGPLGAGKTVFVQGIAKALGLKEAKSPSFVFHRNSLIEKRPFKGSYFHHFDFYRLNNLTNSDYKNFSPYLFDKNGLIFIEWPENIAINKKLDWLIEFKILTEEQREIKIYKNSTD